MVIWAYSLCFDCIIGVPYFVLLYGVVRIVFLLYMFVPMLLVVLLLLNFGIDFRVTFGGILKGV